MPSRRRSTSPAGAKEASRAARALPGLELRRLGSTVEVEANDPDLRTAFETALRQAYHRRDLAAIAAAMAHDLRAPINTMTVQLAVMEEAIAARTDGEAGAKERRRVALLQGELARLGRQLEALFGLLAAEEGFGEIDLRQLTDELALVLTATGRRRQVTVTHLPGEEPAPVVASAWGLRQAFLRLGLLVLSRTVSCGELLLALEVDRDLAALTIAAVDPGSGPVPPPMVWPSEGALEIHPPTGFTSPLHSAEALLASQGATLTVLPDGFSIGFLLYIKE